MKKRTCAKNADTRYVLSAETLREAMAEGIEKLFAMVVQDRKLKSRFWKDATLRIAWIAYAVRTVVCRAYLDTRPGQTDYFDRQAFLDGIAYNPETADGLPRLVGLTGDAVTDSVTNHAANRARAMTPSETLDFIKSAYYVAVDKAAEDARRGQVNLEFLPLVPATEKDVLAFFTGLTTVMTRKDVDPKRLFRKPLDMTTYVMMAAMPCTFESINGWATSSILASYGLPAHGHTSAGTPTWQDVVNQFLYGPTAEPKSEVVTNDELIRMHRDRLLLAVLHSEDTAIESVSRDAALAKKQAGQVLRLQDRIAGLQAENESLKARIAATARSGRAVETLRQENDRMAQDLRREQTDTVRLRQENERLMLELTGRADQSAELEALRTQNEAMAAQIEALLAALSDDGEPKARDDKPTDPSVLDGLSIVVVGGTPTFTAILKTVHPGLKCYGTTRPPADALEHADAVWMQTRCIPHKISVPVLDACRRRGIPIRFFSSKSADRCVRQLLSETPDAAASAKRTGTTRTA